MQAVTCCFALRKRIILGKKKRGGFRKVGKAQACHVSECQIKKFGPFKEFHEVSLI